jgi:signal transduction histidine kinase
MRPPPLASRDWTRRIRHWLRKPQIEDPVERRNAPMLQLVLAAFGIVMPAMAVLRWSQSWSIVPIDLGTEVLVLVRIAFAWTCFYLVRIGRFRTAVGLFVASNLAGLAFSYACYGLKAQLSSQLVHVFALLFGGLLLGRQPLWWIALSLLSILFLGTGYDLAAAGQIPMLRIEAWTNMLGSILGFGGVALILDRAVSALRETLDVATRRGQALALARDRLEREVVERERSQAQLAHARKMDAIGRLASGVAHDFNNILGVILGYASRPSAPDDANASETALAGIRATAKRGALVTQRLLSLGRDEAPRAEVTDLADTIDALKPLLVQVFQNPVKVAIDIEEQPLPVIIDRSEFELALLNIAANARDAMPVGGRFEIHAQTCATGGAEWVVLTLTDTGSGMTPEVLKRMFEPFFTTKPRGTGTGLGLAAVQRLIGAAGGRIDVESTPGRGTSLRIELPLADTTATRIAAIANAPAPDVLLIDDDDALRGVLTDALRAAGYRVAEARTGRDAEQIVARTVGLGTIVSDFQLPDVTADVLLPRLRALQPGCRIVLVSGENAASTACADGLVATFLRKPFAPQELLDHIDKLHLAT